MREIGRRNRALLDVEPITIESARQIADDEISSSLRPALRRIDDGFEISGHGPRHRQNRSIVLTNAVVVDKALLLGVGQFRQRLANGIDILRTDLDGKQIRIREVAIVVRFFLGPHGTRLVLIRVI